MKHVAACGILILLLDAGLCLVLWAELVLMKCCGRGGLAGVWAFGAAKWVILRVSASVLSEGKPPPVLCKLVALLCLLSPVFESGRFLAAPPGEPYAEPSPDLGVLLLGQVSSVLACVVWELVLGADGKAKQDNKVDVKRVLMRTASFFKPDTLYIIAAFSFLILGVACDTVIPLYQGKVIDKLKGGLLHSGFCYAIGQLALASLGSALFSGLRGGTFMSTLARLNRRLKHQLFHSLLQQEVLFFEKNKSGSLSSRLHSDVDRMGRTVALNANAFVRSTVKGFLMLTLMLNLSWELTVLTCIEMPLMAIVHKKYIAHSSEMKKQIQDCLALNKDLASETIKRIHTVRSFRTEKDELRRYYVALDQMNAIKKRAGLYSAVVLLIRRVVTLGIKLLMLLRASSLISSGHLTTGSLVSFLLYQKPMLNNLKEILYSYGETISTTQVISSVLGFLDRKPLIRMEGDLAPEKLEGRIVFQNVTFAYPLTPVDKPVLKSVSMELQPGKMTAMVGPSGGGKTSCVSLLKRLYEPQEGEILLDGHPLHHYKLKYLHQKVALVSQCPELFSGSLRDNIKYGLKDCSDDKMERAAKKAKADGFISALENKYDTDIGECGDKLSKGVQHCIAVIRALIRDPQVIILDETTSKMDDEVWRAVLQDSLSCGRTVLVVAHKLKTVETADHIIFIENGEVVEEGTHHELKAKRGRYHQFSQTHQ